MEKYNIFDGHNDVLFRLYLKNHNLAYQDFLNGDNEGHLLTCSHVVDDAVKIFIEIPNDVKMKTFNAPHTLFFEKKGLKK